jgi:phosphate transport system substrate-binding protein
MPRPVTFALAIVLAVSPIVAHSQEITGAGASFPAPLYTAWGQAADPAIGVRLNYQGLTSGTGVSQVVARTVDFGASDAPVAPQRLQSANLLQFPTVIGAVVVVVNIPGIEANQLKLTGELIGDIYLGKVTKWNDPRIADLNPDLKLPALAIVPIFRAGTSGTNFVFTSYLSAVSPVWKRHPGVGPSVHWDAGFGTRGSSNESLTVQTIRGGIGYVASSYATQHHLVTVRLRNKAGRFVEPARPAFEAAAARADWKTAPDFAVNLIDQGGDQTWPIEAATFILLPRDPKDAASSAAVIKFFDWAFAEGGRTAEEKGYLPLPPSVQDAVRQAWRTEVKTPDGKPVL